MVYRIFLPLKESRLSNFGNLPFLMFPFERKLRLFSWLTPSVLIRWQTIGFFYKRTTYLVLNCHSYRKRTKKRKKKAVGNSHTGRQFEQGGIAGEKESKNPVNKGEKLCGEKSKREVEKLSEETSVAGGGERNANGREQRQQRPRTALGRWLKK